MLLVVAAEQAVVAEPEEVLVPEPELEAVPELEVVPAVVLAKAVERASVTAWAQELLAKKVSVLEPALAAQVRLQFPPPRRSRRSLAMPENHLPISALLRSGRTGASLSMFEYSQVAA